MKYPFDVDIRIKQNIENKSDLSLKEHERLEDLPPPLNPEVY